MGLFKKNKSTEGDYKMTEPVVQDPQQPPVPDQVVQETPMYNPQENIPQVAPQPQPVVQEKVWSVRNVATQTEPVIFNSNTNKPYTVMDVLVEILNRIEE